MNGLIGLSFGLASMLCFGVQDFLMARASRKVGAFKTSLWVNIVSFGVLLAMALFLFNYTAIGIGTLALIAVAAGLSFTGLISFNKGLRVGNVSIVATVASGWGAISAILGVVLLGERITGLQMLYICIIVIGTILVSFELKNILGVRQKKRVLGLECAIVTVFAWGAYFFLVSVLVGIFGWFTAAFLVTAPTLAIFLIYGARTRSGFGVSTSELPLVLGVGGLSIIGFLAYSIGVSYNYTAIVAPVSAAAPAITIILALLLLKERLANNQKLGMVLILIGLILLSI